MILIAFLLTIYSSTPNIPSELSFKAQSYTGTMGTNMPTTGVG